VQGDPRHAPPGGPAAGEPLPEPLPAEAKSLDNKLHSLHSLDIAIHEAIAKGHYDTAQQFHRIAREHALAALEAALECVALPPDGRRRFSADAIQHAEQLLKITPGTFSSFFAVNLESDEREKRKALKELLVEVRNDIRDTPVDKAPRTAPAWLPAILRIGSAVLVAAAVGAPLAALAVGESVVVEIVKAGIAVTACAFATEVTNHALERWLQPSGPAEPMTPAHRLRPTREPADDVAHDLGAPLDLAPSTPAEVTRQELYTLSIHDLEEQPLPSHDPGVLGSPNHDPTGPANIGETPQRRVDDPFSDFGP
jgi:hypothetical protein